jgi:flagellin
VTVNGLTFTASSSMTDAQVAAAFSSLTSGMTAAQASTAHTASSALGSYSGTFTSGFTTSDASASGTAVTATSTTANSNVTDIATSGVSSIVTTSGAGVTESSSITFSDLTPGQSITVNGLTFTASEMLSASQVATAYSSLTSGMTAVQATTLHSASSLLGTYSGTFAIGFTTGASAGPTVTATSTTANSDVSNIAVSTDTLFPSAVETDGLNVLASTVYGTVTLKSENSFTLNGSEDTLRTKLGFDNVEVKKENIARLSFQVGANSSQTVTVDIGDFGKDGNITGAITSDSAATSISTVNGAQNVMDLMNTALNAVAAERSNLGSLINRLQAISDNLTSVQTNEVASRSQIEDADFALASTAASKAQIMTQAATAVLAQANTDMQTVLKLLQ